LSILDNQLKSGKFVVGEDVTVADITIAIPLFHALRLFLVENDRK